jgi:hypothetical protein
MKDIKHKALNGLSVQEAIRAEAVSEPLTVNEFWGDFRARAQIHPQYVRTPTPIMHHLLRWGAVAASCMLLMTGAGIWRYSTPTVLSRIESFDVSVPHDAVMLLDDDESNSTLLWIVGMDEASSGDHG